LLVKFAISKKRDDIDMIMTEYHRRRLFV